MKRFVLVILAFSLAAWLQMPAPYAAPALPAGLAQIMMPTNTSLVGGTALTETFGRGDQRCGTGNPSTCSQRWTTISGAPFVGTSGLVLDAAEQLDTYGSFPFFDLTSAANSIDVYVVVMFATNATTQSTSRFISLQKSQGSTAEAAFLAVSWPAGEGPKVRGSNTDTSSLSITSALTVGTLAYIKMHIQGGAAAAQSYIQVNGGAQRTFTATSTVPDRLRIFGTASNMMTVYSVRIDSSAGGFNPPSMLTDFAGTAGTVTPSKLAASTYCSNQSHAAAATGWSVSGSSSGMSYDTGVAHALNRPVMVCGQLKSGDSGVTLKHDFRSDNFATYTIYTSGTASSISFSWMTDFPAVGDGGFHDFAALSFASGGNPTMQFTTTGALQLEFQDTGAISRASMFTTPMVPGTWYQTIIRMDTGTSNPLTVQLLDANGTLLETKTPANARQGGTPGFVVLGKAGAEATAGEYYVWFANLKVDYERGSTGLAMQQ